jgi:hypothetical protein
MPSVIGADYRRLLVWHDALRGCRCQPVVAFRVPTNPIV